MRLMTVEEKGSRNKRKFRADPLLADPNKIFPSPPNECTSFEFSAEKVEIPPSRRHANSCDTSCMNHNKSDALKLDLGLACAEESCNGYEVGTERAGITKSAPRVDRVGESEGHAGC
ncbi:unnamed protein product [Fraxinus pennsylvanica]|uniref:Uncharacterized protein n=1 Tax=Fraxinus pennsylvanica TaxID=56036 RepID=A0AAD2E6Q2_9LAMI|nr:unnamed protein product [Fraxinus pennsylvanica]